MEGTRPLLVEVQALASHSSFGYPRRTANGVDLNRLLLIVAVLSRRVGLRLFDQDVFVNVIGGLQVEEPAADLAVAVAIGSSVRDRPVAADVAVIGEVGLSGEVRAARGDRGNPGALGGGGDGEGAGVGRLWEMCYNRVGQPIARLGTGGHRI
jgi:predicted ATP-dependent serine protease